ncbi:MAG: DUF1775 domain-containing protein [Labilithrix sp.]|nr:DUF1775 domain-containing protein [Labilithrix sp.]MCW5813815.1 DUF1775 domain-containing protein [Labilithrix sp.]
MKIKLSAAVVASTSLLVAAGASAHVGAGTPVLNANANQEVVLTIGHGCDVEGANPPQTTDTISLKVDVPAGVTGVRAISNADFPTVTLDKDGDGNVTAITWSKADGLDADSQYYKVSFRARMPAAPFTKVYFKSHQKCKAPGKDAEWIRTPTENPGAEPAAEVTLLPAKAPGWNKYKVPVAIDDVAASGFFKDAQIVWKGSAAFSANAVTAEQIKTEAGVTALTSIAVDEEIFVKW